MSPYLQVHNDTIQFDVQGQFNLLVGNIQTQDAKHFFFDSIPELIALRPTSRVPLLAVSCNGVENWSNSIVDMDTTYTIRAQQACDTLDFHSSCMDGGAAGVADVSGRLCIDHGLGCLIRHINKDMCF
jgi:hypothetical protein